MNVPVAAIGSSRPIVNELLKINMAVPFKLSCSLTGHESDVRAVAAGLFPEGSIITASRDRTARLWVPSR